VSFWAAPGDDALMPLAQQAHDAGILMMYENVDLPKVRQAYGGGYIGADLTPQGMALGNEAINSFRLQAGDKALVFGAWGQPGRLFREEGTAVTLCCSEQHDSRTPSHLACAAHARDSVACGCEPRVGSPGHAGKARASRRHVPESSRDRAVAARARPFFRFSSRFAQVELRVLTNRSGASFGNAVPHCSGAAQHTGVESKQRMADPQRPGLKLGSRTEFLVIGDVIPGHEDALRQILKEDMANPRTRQAVEQIGTLHEARFTLLDDGKRLLFCSSFDGTWDAYIDAFVATATGRSFDETWEHVQGYPGVRSPAVKDWFAAHQVQAGNFVCAYPKPTVKLIWYALAVQRAFDQVLDTPGAVDALQHPALKPLLELAAD
jgi:hypothetical protein